MMGQTRSGMAPAVAAEQGGRTIQYAPSAVRQTSALQTSAPDQYSGPIGPPTNETTADNWGAPAGGSNWSGMANNQNPSVMMANAPACLSTDLALAMMQCIANPTPECMSYLDPNYLALPLCAGSTPPPVPECMDAQLAEGISYCEEFGYAGANKEMNALCWLASKNPAWYDQVSALPECGSNGKKEPTEEEKKKKKLLIGGILLLVVAGGATAYYFAQKKKKH